MKIFKYKLEIDDQGHAYGFDEVSNCFDNLAYAFILFKEAQ